MQLLGSGAASSLRITLQQQINIEDINAIAKDASDAIMQIHNDPSTWDVQHKQDNSPITKADIVANTLICSRLKQLTPHIPIISEENKEVAYEIRQHYHCCWCVDPIDGTKEFVKRTGEFTVNIALLHGPTPVLGVVMVPTTGVLYYAVQGGGAFKREGGVDVRLAVQEFDMTQPNLDVVASRSYMSDATRTFVDRLHSPNFHSMGSSLKLVLVAEGRAALYPRMAPTSEWDTAAAHAVVLEAGGRVLQAGRCDSKGGALEDWEAAYAKRLEVVYNKEHLLNPFFVVEGRRRDT